MRTAKLSYTFACIVAAAISLFFFSCCPCKHLSTDIKDSVRVETHYVTIERIDTQIVELPIEVYRNVTRDTFSVVSTRYAVSTARIDSGFLWHDIRTCGSVPVLVKTVTEYKDSIVYRDREVTNTVQVKQPLTKWQRFQKGGFWVLLVLIVVSVGGYVAFKFIRR